MSRKKIKDVAIGDVVTFKRRNARSPLGGQIAFVTKICVPTRMVELYVPVLNEKRAARYANVIRLGDG